jgi:hypothetical protein
MFLRSIAVEDIKAVLSHGDAIESYPDDTPYPSCLLLGKVQARVLHVVVAQNSADGACVVIAAYEPNPTLWSADYRTRKK